jgi:hypothetical protein
MSAPSWLKKVGSVLAKVLHVIAEESQPIEKIAVPVAKALLPQFASEIDKADGIFSGIVKEAVAAEAVVQAGGATTGGGTQKLSAVLASAGPLLDNWVASNFPGSPQVSIAAKSGLINAIVAILNEVQPTTPVAPATPPTN